MLPPEVWGRLHASPSQLPALLGLWPHASGLCLSPHGRPLLPESSLLSPLRTLVSDLGPSQITQDDFLSRSLITFAEILIPKQAFVHMCQGVECGHDVLEAIIPPPSSAYRKKCQSKSDVNT